MPSLYLQLRMFQKFACIWETKIIFRITARIIREAVFILLRFKADRLFLAGYERPRLAAQKVPSSIILQPARTGGWVGAGSTVGWIGIDGVEGQEQLGTTGDEAGKVVREQCRIEAEKWPQTLQTTGPTARPSHPDHHEYLFIHADN